MAITSARRQRVEKVVIWLQECETVVFWDWGNYIHQLAHASSPSVPNTASRRALSGAFSLKCSVHAGTSSNASRTASATGHAYAGTSESICGRISSRVTPWEETEGTHGRRLRVHCPRPSPCAHRAEHGARDLHRTILRRRTHPHLVWPWLLPDEAKAIMVEFPQVLNNARGCMLGE